MMVDPACNGGKYCLLSAGLTEDTFLLRCCNNHSKSRGRVVLQLAMQHRLVKRISSFQWQFETPILTAKKARISGLRLDISSMSVSTSRMSARRHRLKR